MLSHFLMVKKNGQIFINAAGGDSQEIVVRRAARVALRENKTINYQVINKEEKYRYLSVDEAKKIMTPEAWVEELRDPFSDPLKRKEADQELTKSLKKRIVAELKKQRTQLYERCLDREREIDRVTKTFNI